MIFGITTNSLKLTDLDFNHEFSEILWQVRSFWDRQYIFLFRRKVLRLESNLHLLLLRQQVSSRYSLVSHRHRWLNWFQFKMKFRFSLCKRE